MREMLEKVPEEDWFCEECQDALETENKRLGKSEVVYMVLQKNAFWGQTFYILYAYCFMHLILSEY